MKSPARYLSALCNVGQKLILRESQIYPATHLFRRHYQSFTSDAGLECPDDMELKSVVRKLEALAPTSLAGSWDNVGLLVEPSGKHQVNTMLLTNDLTELVLEEATEKKADLVLSYHPPIFRPLKRLSQCAWKERIVVKCVENRIAVYSPHTSFDAVKGGVNDWLISPFSEKSQPLELSQSSQFPTPGGSRVEVSVPEDTLTEALSQLMKLNGVTLMGDHSWTGDKDIQYRKLYLNCTKSGLPAAVACISQWGYNTPLEVMQLTKPPLPDHGPGRLAKLQQPMSIKDAVNKVKGHLNLPHLRLALAVGASQDTPIKSVAVCAGSGASVLQGVKADLYLTGEMSHHEVLDANHRGTSVILCDHSNTERGFLSQQLQSRLTDLFENKISVIVSQTDRDPLEIV